MSSQEKPAPEARTSAATRTRSGRWGRWVAVLAAIVILLPAAILAAAAWLLPSEVVARAAAERAEVALGVPVSIGDIEIDFWPVPSVSLLRSQVGADSAPVASIERILLRPRLLPLLSGDVIVREIAVIGPDVHLLVDSSGAMNLPFAREEGGASEASTAEVEFAIDEFSIRDGRLRYTDLRDGTDVTAHDLRQTLQVEGRVAAGTLARIGLSGTIASDSVDAALPGRLAVPLHGVRFALQHDAELDREADRLDIGELRLELQRMVLTGSGRIESVSDSLARTAELELGAEEFGFEDLARSLPEGLLAGVFSADASQTASSPGDGPAAEMEYAGRASIAARVRGPVTADTLPRIEGSVRLREVGVSQNGIAVVEGAAGRIDFSNDAVTTDGLTGDVFGQPFTARFQANNLAEPVIEFEARGTVALAELLALRQTAEPTEASGALPFDLSGRLVPGDPATSSVTGTVEIRSVRAELPSLRQPIQVPSGRLRFAGQELRLEEVAVAFGESRVNASATVQDWLPVLLGDSTALALVRFDARAGTLDLDALLGPSESEYAPLLFARLADRPVNGKSAAEAAEEVGLSLPELPRLRAQGDLTAERLVRNGLVYQDLELALESSPTAVSAPRLRFGFMGGTVELGVALERGGTEGTLVAVYHLENVGAEAFFSRFTPFQGRLSGLMTLDGEVSLQLDEHMLPVRPTVRSSGQMALTSGSLASWPLLSKVGERLGLQSFDTLAFREWSGEYLVAGPLVTLERAVQVSPRMQTELAGSFDFGGKLDLAVVANLSPELAAAAGEQIRSAALALAGEEGTVPIGLRITGSVTAPSISLDLSSARDRALARARQRATEEAESAARRAASQVAEQVLGDSVPLAPEEVGAAVRERVQDRIRGLFGRRADQPADTAAGDTAASDTASSP